MWMQIWNWFGVWFRLYIFADNPHLTLLFSSCYWSCLSRIIVLHVSFLFDKPCVFLVCLALPCPAHHCCTFCLLLLLLLLLLYYYRTNSTVLSSTLWSFPVGHVGLHVSLLSKQLWNHFIFQWNICAKWRLTSEKLPSSPTSAGRFNKGSCRLTCHTSPTRLRGLFPHALLKQFYSILPSVFFFAKFAQLGINFPCRPLAAPAKKLASQFVPFPPRVETFENIFKLDRYIRILRII